MAVFWVLVVLIAFSVGMVVWKYIKWHRSQPDKPLIDDAREATFDLILASLEERPDQWSFGNVRLDRNGRSVLEPGPKREWLFNNRTGVMIFLGNAIISTEAHGLCIRINKQQGTITPTDYWRRKLGKKVMAMAKAEDEALEMASLKKLVRQFNEASLENKL